MKIKMRRQHLEMMEGTTAEVDFGVAHELIKRGIAEIEPVDKVRFEAARAKVNDGVPAHVIEQRRLALANAQKRYARDVGRSGYRHLTYVRAFNSKGQEYRNEAGHFAERKVDFNPLVTLGM